ncbi:MAG: DUF1707 domain-containing protein [Streptosporangiaceae bacterium]
MDDRIRMSDADRERVTSRLREHYAEGRLSSEELDERITATLSAKTFGDLRGVLADLPEPDLLPPPAGPTPPWRGMPPRVVVHRGPRLLPLLLIALIVAVALPGAGFVFFAFVKIALLIWLAMMVLGIVAAGRFRRHVRRHLQSGYGSQRDHHHSHH